MSSGADPDQGYASDDSEVFFRDDEADLEFESSEGEEDSSDEESFGSGSSTSDADEIGDYVDPWAAPANAETSSESKEAARVVLRRSTLASDDESDSSEDEGVSNTIGNVPLEWYEDEDHIGYDVEGNRIQKKDRGDELQQLLKNADNPDFLRSVVDELHDQDIKISNEQLQQILKMQRSQYIHDIDPFPKFEDTFEFNDSLHPLSNMPDSKRRFMPSVHEAKRIARLVKAIKEGRVKPYNPDKKDEDESPYLFDVWSNDADASTSTKGILAPKERLPGHEASYRPPQEYLLTQEEEQAWKEKDPLDRETNFLPASHARMRYVPMYENLIRERFTRCLDLYLCPRVKKEKLQIDPESLLPQLPKPRDLRPFPSKEVLRYEGLHESRVRALDIDSSGQFLASGDEKGMVGVWEVDTGRCLFTWKIPAASDMTKKERQNIVVHEVRFNPAGSRIPVLAVAWDLHLTLLLCPFLCSEDALQQFVETLGVDSAEDAVSRLPWTLDLSKPSEFAPIVDIPHAHPVKRVAWHNRGDYFSTVCPDANSASSAVHVHQLSKRASQTPFSGLGSTKIQSVAFHPTKPYMLVATQIYVRIYNLLKQDLVQKLVTGVQYISSIDVHPSGDHVIVSSYDCKTCWFDCDLSTRPYKVMRQHHRATRKAVYHPRLPLFATGSDDGTVVVFHGRVYDDFMQNPMIVPVKVLPAAEVTQDGLGVLNVCFHPHRPWLFSCGADHTIRLFT